MSRQEKIVNIGEQLSYPFILKNFFSDHQDKYAELIDKLSGAKRKIKDRAEATELMNLGTEFLRALLSAIDPNKIRKPR
jgi:hypothetical protein